MEKKPVATSSDIPLCYTPICGPQEDSSRKSARKSQAHGSLAETGNFQLDPNAPTFATFANPLLTGTAQSPQEDRENSLVNNSDLPEKQETEFVLTFLDCRADFDSVSHKFLDETLREAGCSNKTRAIFRGIYLSASAVVRAN